MAVVGTTTIKEDVGSGSGTSNDIRSTLSVIAFDTSAGCVRTSGEVFSSTVLVNTCIVVVKVVAGSIDMTIGVSPPVFVEVAIAPKRAR